MVGNTLRSAFGLCGAATEAGQSSLVRVPKRTVWSLAEAREAIERLIGLRDRLVRPR